VKTRLQDKQSPLMKPVRQRAFCLLQGFRRYLQEKFLKSLIVLDGKGLLEAPVGVVEEEALGFFQGQLWGRHYFTGDFPGSRQ